jgi:hypothetical protein
VEMLPRPKSLITCDGHEACTRLFSFENKNLLPSGGPKNTTGEKKTCLEHLKQFETLIK